MKKIMKTFEAIELYNSLSTLVQDKTRKLPGNIAFAILRTYKKLNEIKNDYDEVMNGKFKVMSEEGKLIITNGENGEQNFHIPNEYAEEFLNFREEVSSAECDVELHTISQESFNKLIEYYELSISEVEGVEKLIKNSIEIEE